jgi:hypothetical protein
MVTTLMEATTGAVDGDHLPEAIFGSVEQWLCIHLHTEHIPDDNIDDRSISRNYFAPPIDKNFHIE